MLKRAIFYPTRHSPISGTVAGRLRSFPSSLDFHQILVFSLSSSLTITTFGSISFPGTLASEDGARSNSCIGLARRYGETRTKRRTWDRRTAYLTERRLQPVLFSLCIDWIGCIEFESSGVYQSSFLFSGFFFFKHCSIGGIKFDSCGVYPTSFLLSSVFFKHCSTGSINFESSGVYPTSFLFLFQRTAVFVQVVT